MDQFDALPLHLGKHFAEYLESFRVRVSDGHGFPLLLGPVNGKFQLAANGASLLNIIEERHIAESAWNPVLTSGTESDGCRGGAAIDEEEVPLAKKGHEFRHEGGIGSG